jgi:hypothetical protein
MTFKETSVTRTVLVLATLAASLLAGCAPTLTRGARPILPQQTTDTANVWVYLDVSDADLSGVYRCRDVGEQVTCVKAKLVTK